MPGKPHAMRRALVLFIHSDARRVRNIAGKDKDKDKDKDKGNCIEDSAGRATNRFVDADTPRHCREAAR